MFKTIDKYIFKELIDPFIFGLLSFSLILSASMVLFELTRAVVLQGMPMFIALKLFIFRLPSVVVYIFPMATLLAALLGFSRLSKDSEITAFKASGISLFRLMVPVVVMGLAISIITLLFYEIVVPESNKMSKNIMMEFATKKTIKIEENIFVPEFENGELKRIFYARRMKGDILEGIIVSEFFQGRLSQIINAFSAEWGENQWVFSKGTIYLLSEEGEYKHLIKFDKQKIAIKYSPKELSNQDKSPDDMSISELRQYIPLKEKMGVKVTDYKIQLNMKMSIPFACLVFALLGAPLGISPRRVSSSVGLGFSIIVIFIYYVLMFTSVAFGELEVLSPPVAAWLPNIITGGIGIYFVNKTAQS
ncbi:MAG: Permease YjgP/YjgQ family protein [Candidatus Saganbacteria bacterium]|uniref:Permease YjgP/YjgQ family protein n=1 Tax=Candidatus Saganbacteria bacterium TaxID=2575572 RepID=A0A833NYD7_UNCSA|nr:MAG: Permease YjgP/YjgQ family protein [Candidatus Saganbacteria bacterium]